jgi:hypothetical protein
MYIDVRGAVIKIHEIFKARHILFSSLYLIYLLIYLCFGGRSGT